MGGPADQAGRAPSAPPGDAKSGDLAGGPLERQRTPLIKETAGSAKAASREEVGAVLARPPKRRAKDRAKERADGPPVTDLLASFANKGGSDTRSRKRSPPMAAIPVAEQGGRWTRVVSSRRHLWSATLLKFRHARGALESPDDGSRAAAHGPAPERGQAAERGRTADEAALRESFDRDLGTPLGNSRADAHALLGAAALIRRLVAR